MLSTTFFFYKLQSRNDNLVSFCFQIIPNFHEKNNLIKRIENVEKKHKTLVK